MGARAHAARGTLLSKASTEKLAESSSLEEYVDRLKATSYSAALSRLQPPYSARKLELALRERLADVHFLLLNAAKKYELLRLYYFRKIAWDLKSALKSRALGKSYSESVEFLDMYAEELVGRRDLIVKVLSARDIGEAASLLAGTEFGEAVARAAVNFNTKGDLRFFDLCIDHPVLTMIAKEYADNAESYSSPRSFDVAGTGEMVALDVDSYNILAVLRTKLWGLPEAETRSLLILPAYRIRLDTLQNMITVESISEAIKLVKGVYGLSVPESSSQDEQVDAVETRLIDESRRVATRSFVWQKLGFANALALTKLLEFEVTNLAAVALGIEAHLPPKDVLSKLRF